MTDRLVTLSLDDAMLLALYGEAVAKHTQTLTDNDHVLLWSCLERVWTALNEAERGGTE